ncbi:hypothetical protein JCM14469_31040 [Desulfatiferula olefinivorans]
MKLKTCVSPAGRFVYGLHRPFFHIENFRKNDGIRSLGRDDDGNEAVNTRNFPTSAVNEPRADVIYEVHNPFPFRGATFINSVWADAKSKNPESITLPRPKPMSFSKSLGEVADLDRVFAALPQPVLLTIASESTDPAELIRLARLCCTVQYRDGVPDGLLFEKTGQGHLVPVIRNHELFESLVNNPCLPQDLREVMVLRPGIQGGSEIVGEYENTETGVHVYEYLRRNSYIPWGHFAANMAEDSPRYDMAGTREEDIRGLRFLYYQRTYSRVGAMLGLTGLSERTPSSEKDLEDLRRRIMDTLIAGKTGPLMYNATLWGWNYGFHFTASGYNLHGSHQQIHQQYALIPREIDGFSSFDHSVERIPTYGCGDQVHAFITDYRRKTGQDFFTDYIRAIRSNARMDVRDPDRSSLVVYEDEHVMLFVPKAQTSQWELNLMPKQPLAHILATDHAVRRSLDTAMWRAMTLLTTLGARMITCIEFSGRFDAAECGQHLLYAFLPKIPYSMGAFTEAQLRFICGHYPEDFAAACRSVLTS